MQAVKPRLVFSWKVFALLMPALLPAMSPGCHPSVSPTSASHPGGALKPHNLLPVASPADQAAVERLLDLMRSRLELMHDVARAKWNDRLAIEDPVREQAQLAELTARGKEMGLDAHAVRWFFASQMEAAKQVQREDFERWRREGPERFEVVVSLAELRARLDRLNLSLLEAWRSSQGVAWEIWRSQLAERPITGGISAEAWRVATTPLREPR